MFGEDFGYQKNSEIKLGFLAKKSFIIGLVVLSLILFFYVTINAYYFSRHENGDAKLIEGPKEHIKVKREIPSNSIRYIDKEVYETIIVGGDKKKSKKDKIKIIKPVETVLPEKKAVKSKEEKILVEDDLQKIDLIKKDKKISQPKKGSEDKKMAKWQQYKKPEAGLSRVQIAALSKEVAAINYFNKLKKKHPDLFGGLKYFVNRVDLGKRGIFYRLQIGNFSSQDRAEKFCRDFISLEKVAKLGCIIVE